MIMFCSKFEFICHSVAIGKPNPNQHDQSHRSNWQMVSGYLLDGHAERSYQTHYLPVPQCHVVDNHDNESSKLETANVYVVQDSKYLL